MKCMSMNKKTFEQLTNLKIVGYRSSSLTVLYESGFLKKMLIGGGSS
jgi:hypothetical protein